MSSLKVAFVVGLVCQISSGCGNTEVVYGGDAGPQPRQPDAQVSARADGSPLRTAVDGQPHVDTQPLADVQRPDEPPPLPDASGTQTCEQLLACSRQCGPDRACVGACVASGTKEAQQSFGAADKCIKGAFEGACQGKCGGGPGAECDTCVRQACGQQLAKCASRPR